MWHGTQFWKMMDINDIYQNLSTQMQSLSLLLMVVNGSVHVLFAGAVARDAGLLNRVGLRPLLVSAHVWAFATLLGGVYVAAIYWFIHHSTLTRGVNQLTDSSHKS